MCFFTTMTSISMLDRVYLNNTRDQWKKRHNRINKTHVFLEIKFYDRKKVLWPNIIAWEVS